MQISIDYKSLYLGQLSSTDDRDLNDMEMTNSRENEGNLCAGCGAPIRGDDSRTFCDGCR